MIHDEKYTATVFKVRSVFVRRALYGVTMGAAITFRMLPDNINFHLFFFFVLHVTSLVQNLVGFL